jgi:putative Holliday junction resolvase
MGIDYGRKRIGVALGDTETGLAGPWGVVVNQHPDQAMRELIALAKQEGVERFVIGIPKPLGDRSRETDQAQEIRVFAKQLENVGLSVVEEDETLTSALAARQVQEMGEKGKRDDLAATAILQTYLDKHGLPS